MRSLFDRAARTDGSGKIRQSWPLVMARFYQAYFRTLDVRMLLSDGALIHPKQFEFGRQIFAHFECQALALTGMSKYSKFTLLVAGGSDGDWATRAFEIAGYDVIRGSSLHAGSVALLRLLRVLKTSHWPAAISVDGPVGPAGCIQPGVIACAGYVNRAIIPLGVSASRRIVFRKTWSQIFLPLPFSRVVIALGDKFIVPRDCLQGQTQKQQVRKLCDQLGRCLQVAQSRAERAVFNS